MNSEQKFQRKDWHHADIIAALHKCNTSMAAVSRAAGLSSSTLSNALTRPWAKGERLIAEAIGVPACEIWPNRYFDSQGRAIPREMRPRRRKTEKETLLISGPDNKGYNNS